MSSILYLSKPTDAEPLVSKVAFRALDAAVVRLDCVFEAHGAGLRDQDAINVHDLDSSPVVFNLTRVTSQDFLWHLKGDIRFSVESYQFRKLFWNCNSITYAKREIEIYWKWGFVTLGGSVYTPLSSRRYSKTQCWSLWRRAVVWVMA